MFKNLLVSLFLLAAISIPGYAASQEQKETQKQTHNYKGLTQAEIAFEKAHQNFINKKYSPAGKIMMQGRKYVYEAAQQADAVTKSGILAAADKLEKVAKRVEKGEVKEEKELKDAFAESFYSLSQDYYVKARQAFEKQVYDQAGYLLKGTTTQLELGLSWAGEKLDSHTKEVLENARNIGGKLEKGKGWTKEQVEKALADLEQQINKLGEKVKAAQSS